MINQRITKLRQLMKERGIDLYIIPTSDFHQSEYVGSYFEARHYMSGFKYNDFASKAEFHCGLINNVSELSSSL